MRALAYVVALVGLAAPVACQVYTEDLLEPGGGDGPTSTTGGVGGVGMGGMGGMMVTTSSMGGMATTSTMNTTNTTTTNTTDTTNTTNTTNTTGGMGGASGVAWINELHYNNAGADADEGVEVAGTAGLDLAGWSVVLYNGNGGVQYNQAGLVGTIPNQQNGFGTLWFAIPGIQNGDPDGVALVGPGNSVVHFLSYGGSFMATNGAAAGMTSVDIVVSESDATAIGDSLQLTGTGMTYAEFLWSGPTARTPGDPNAGQFFN